MPPHTTKRRAINLKTKNNQKCKKIKLYRCLTNKKLKKKHSSRPVGRVERWAARAERNHGKAAPGRPSDVAGRAGSPTFACG